MIYETRKSLLLSVFYPLIQCIITADELASPCKNNFFSIKSNARFFSHHQSKAILLGDMELLGYSNIFSINMNFQFPGLYSK